MQIWPDPNFMGIPGQAIRIFLYFAETENTI
jgi:hypothetical protein